MKKYYKDIIKRVIAIICAFVLACGIVMAADVSSDPTDELTDKELYIVELLNAIDIYNGVDAVKGKDDFVRRDVFSFLAARIMGIGNFTYQGEPFFSDVDKDNFAYGAINNLAQMDIIKGNGNRKFDPARDVTVDEATVIILRMMGYSQLMEIQGNGIYGELVQKHKLHNGIEYAKDRRLQVKYLSILLYNALTSDFPQVVSISGSGGLEYKIEKGENLLSTMFNVYEIKGIISANERTSVDVDSRSSNGWIKIGSESFNVGKTDADKYIGYYVTAYYIDEPEKTLICLEIDSKNTVIAIDSDNLEYNDFKYTKYIGNTKKTYTISKGLNLIYNGKAIYYDKDKMLPEYGTVSLIDNNKDNIYDTVIVNNVRNLVVGNYGAVSNIIQSKYDNLSVDLNKYDENMCSIHKSDGRPYKLSSIKEWDVLSVVESPDGEYIDITVSNDTLSGRIDMISDSDGITVLTIEGVEYKVASTFSGNKNYDLSSGYNGTFYLDMYGRIAAASGTVSRIKWGYLIKSGKKNGYNESLNIKLLTQDSGKVITFETAEKYFINDVEYKDSDANIPVLNDYQVVRYSLDNEGKIKKLYTAGNGFVELKAKYADGYASNAFGNSIAIDSNTVVMQIPNSTRAGDDKDDESFYALKPVSSFKNGDWYWVSSYGIEPNDVTASLVIVERFYSSAANPSGTYMVVTGVSTVYKDDCIVDKITGYDSAKNKVEIFTRNVGEAAGFGIEEGDFFGMVLYPDGTLQKAVQVYDCQSSVLNTAYSGIAYDQQNFARFGYAFNISSRFLQLSADQFSLYNHKVYSTASAAILIVDCGAYKKNVTVGSLSDIETYEQSGKAAKIVVFGRDSIPRLIVSYQ